MPASFRTFESNKPNAGISPRHNICNRLHGRKYLEEARKGYGKNYITLFTRMLPPGSQGSNA
jgi:hypothetical protein